MEAGELRKGMVIKQDNDLFLVIWCQHHKPGKGGAVMRSRLKNIVKGNVVEKTFRGADNIEEAYVEKREAQLLYHEGGEYHFMDNESFEQYAVSEDIIGDSNLYLKNEMMCTLHIYNSEVILAEPPTFVELEIIETDPGLRGDTVSGGSKPAKLETGAVVQVPLFVNQGERIKIDTRDDRYIERVK